MMVVCNPAEGPTPVPDEHLTIPAQRARPFLKWAGGKRSLLKQYESFFKADGLASTSVETYYEPFVGSAAVFFHLQAEGVAQRYVLSDVNAELVNVYQVVRDELDPLIELLIEYQQRHNRAHYYSVRRRDRDPQWLASASAVERAGRLLYLNRTCFNGLWRVNSRGEFNVPMGQYQQPRIVREELLRAASAALTAVELRASPFDEAVRDAGAGDFVYFDPPYVPLSETSSFTSYAADGFNLADQERLADTFRDLNDRGCRVMLSNSDHPLVHELYDGFRIETVSARRRINSQADGRGPINEVVVLNY
jgi:DNA adenine methylase